MYSCTSNSAALSSFMPGSMTCPVSMLGLHARVQADNRLLFGAAREHSAAARRCEEDVARIRAASRWERFVLKCLMGAVKVSGLSVTQSASRPS